MYCPLIEIIEIKKNYEFKLSKKINPTSWKQIYLNQNNNLNNFEYNNFNEQSEEFNKSSIKSKFILKNYISMTYDDYINSKYDVNIFNNTIERLKNYFK